MKLPAEKFIIFCSSATCDELKKIIGIDRAALKYEKEKLKSMGGDDPAQVKIVEDVEQAVGKQIERLLLLKTSKGC